ncbi:hypothetical protein, conserved [Plasmodium gonderi]|uniref:Uncharacterized protein n=1 Tax=Plasmodium gonderi TaxID=77519 RepID=A0A1Y1JLY7_PLAGO|nr:hypothetical protein, conserved [Plasmodium gonderi]GAW83596.1 hypothetical protein, conserved [Plasmodium gonderi]
MSDDAIDFIFSIILDVEIYLCAFVLLTYITTKKVNKIIQSDFYKNDILLNRLSKNFYILDVKAYFSPLKYMFKSIIYHIYYLFSIIFLIYIFRLYASYKKWIKYYFFSFFNISMDSSLLSDDDEPDVHYNSRNSGVFSIPHIFAFILGLFFSFFFYKYIRKLFIRKKKYISAHKSSLLHYCMELAKINFREYVKINPQKKGSRFKFDLGTYINPYWILNNETTNTNEHPAHGSVSKSGGSGNRNNSPNVVAPKPKKNILFRIFNIVYVKNHVLHDEKLLYDDNLRNKLQYDQKMGSWWGKFLFIIIKILIHIIILIINLVFPKKKDPVKSSPHKTPQSVNPGPGQNTPTQTTSPEGMKQDGTNVKPGVEDSHEENKEMKQPLSKEIDTEMKQPLRKDTDTEMKQPLSKETDTEMKQPLSKEIDTEMKQPLRKDTDTEMKQPLSKETDTEMKQPLSKETDTEMKQPLSKTTVQKQSNNNEIPTNEGKTMNQNFHVKNNMLNMNQMKEGKRDNADPPPFNDIKLCSIDLTVYDIYICNSHVQFKSIIEVLMLHVPIYLLFKNKFYAKTCFTIAMYVLNYFLWYLITFLATIKPSIYVYYYLLNDHINQILRESISENEKNIILHFFYGFFFASLIYLKFYFNMEFKLIKIDHMNHFHKMINLCIAEANTLKSKKIIKNFEILKIFPLTIDYKNKGIFIEKSLLRTVQELEFVLKQRKIKKAKICFQNVKQIAKYCDEDTAMELFKRIKQVLINELPHRVALNLSLMISDEMYNKLKNGAVDSSSSEPLKKHPPDCLCELLKKTVIHDFIKVAMGVDKPNAEPHTGQANADGTYEEKSNPQEDAKM